MIELTPEDLLFQESAEFPGLQIRTHISQAATALETRKMQHYQDQRLVNLGTVDFLMAHFCGTLYPAKTMDEYRKDLANFLSRYVFKRVVEFEHDKRSDIAIASWMRQISRKVELQPTDVEFKKTLDAAMKEQIEWAAKALENATRQRTDHGEFATGSRRSVVGVLLDFIPVNGRRWGGGTLALSENAAEANKMRRQSSEKDQENRHIALEQLRLRLSEHIVGRMGYLDGTERYSFKEVAKWLRLFLVD
jgi:hypothetical protein